MVTNNKRFKNICDNIGLKIYYNEDTDILEEIVGITRSEIPGEILEEVKSINDIILSEEFLDLLEEKIYDFPGMWDFNEFRENTGDLLSYFEKLLNLK